MRQGELGWAHQAPPRSPPGSAGARRVFLPLPRLDFCLVQGPISAVPLAWVPEPHAVSSALTPPCVADTHLSQAESLASTTRVCSSKEKKTVLPARAATTAIFLLLHHPPLLSSPPEDKILVRGWDRSAARGGQHPAEPPGWPEAQPTPGDGTSM